MLRVCYVCKIEKDIEDFPFHSKQGYRRGICRICTRERERRRNRGDHNKDWYSRNKEKVKLRVRRSYLANPEKTAARLRKNKYGLNVEQYCEMLWEQNGRCAICSNYLTKPFVDHDHKTGKARQLLCRNCNTAVGMSKENTHILQRMIEYLIKHKEAIECPTQLVFHGLPA